MNEAVQPVPLAVREYGDRAAGRPGVLLLHGLLGSASNWHSYAQHLAPTHRVLVPDLRNHGRSAHHPSMDYPPMAADVLAVLDAQAVDRVTLIGHSMGGKVAMTLALRHPARVAGLVVVDIAPVSYADRYTPILAALRSLDLPGLQGRAEADTLLARRIPSPAIRQFLLQNLQREGEAWRWRMNLAAIAGAIEGLMGFPQEGALAPYTGRGLFLYGEESDYVRPHHHDEIRRLFPAAVLHGIAGAGHWVYAERPEAFRHAMAEFLRA